MADEHKTIADLGEKEIIQCLLRPLFNPDNDRNSVGDDCAALEIPVGSLALISTDRVPADLISFRTGILDYFGLGRYLAVLNFSDIAACGGIPQALLLNFGLPAHLPVSALLEICKGVMHVAENVSAKVMGGDLTASSEVSISATAFGHVEKDKILRRSGARVGDSVFVSRPIGLTPVALHYCLNPGAFEEFKLDEVTALKEQFTRVMPMTGLGRRLAEAEVCTAAMDNTDGLWQSLNELSKESGVSIALDERLIGIAPVARKFAAQINCDAPSFAFGAGADFSLIGTLRGGWTTNVARELLGADTQIIGQCYEGQGVTLRSGQDVRPFEVQGWNYFSAPRDHQSSEVSSGGAIGSSVLGTDLEFALPSSDLSAHQPDVVHKSWR